jgi:hypothetical protein
MFARDKEPRRLVSCRQLAKGGPQTDGAMRHRTRHGSSKGDRSLIKVPRHRPRPEGLLCRGVNIA